MNEDEQNDPLGSSMLVPMLRDFAARFGEPTTLRAAYRVGDVQVEIAMYRLVRETADESDDQE